MPVVITLPPAVVAARLASLATSFAMVDTLEELAIATEEAVEGFIGADYHGLYVWDQEASGLRLLYSVGFSEEERIEAERTALDRHPGSVYRSGAMLYVRDVEEDSEGTESSSRSFVVRSRLFVPVVFREEALGVLGLASQLPDRFRDDDVALVRFLAQLVAVVYRRILDRRDNEQRQAEDRRALARSNADLLKVQADLVAANTALEGRVASRTRDLEVKNASLQRALAEVEKTHEQMMNGEKMASLGLLVAGIAHEIKNPLNFVINFSDVSASLLGELTEAIAADVRDVEVIDDLIADLAENLRRIQAQGERVHQTTNAMLMHARESSGEVVECNLNSVIKEHATLAYKATRTLDPSFHADLQTDFDPRLEDVRVPLQEVSRVLVNLVNNACHAMLLKLQSAEAGYTPTINLTTRLLDGMIQIVVRDNGTGIRPEVRSRLFDPFFTTKKAGEGTGLGLSIAYDIVVKQLGGRLLVSSEVGRYASFTAELPMGQRTRGQESVG